MSNNVCEKIDRIRFAAAHLLKEVIVVLVSPDEHVDKDFDMFDYDLWELLCVAFDDLAKLFVQLAEK